MDQADALTGFAHTSVTFDAAFALECGATLPAVTVAYRTYGTLNPDRSNAVLVCHALTGDQYVAERHPITGKGGWWDQVVGPGRPVDTERYFVICANVLGGCMGSTGPRSPKPRLNPASPKPAGPGPASPKSGSLGPASLGPPSLTPGRLKPATPNSASLGPAGAPPEEQWGIDFPPVTIRDMVRAQKLLVDHLGIERLFAVIGGSMGGMQVLQWAASYPDMVFAALPLATAAYHSAQNIAFHEVGRQSIFADPEWLSGQYWRVGKVPARGLAVARMCAHITYLSEEALTRKFGRRLQSAPKDSSEAIDLFGGMFQVQSYLQHQGSTFVERFDANSYLTITRAMDYFDLAADYGDDLAAAFNRTATRFLLVSFTSDWLFPTQESRTIARALNRAGANVSFVEIPTNKGHDAFLLDEPDLHRTLAGFLRGCAVHAGLSGSHL